ncbi:hypothetical protein BDV93DRAFT_332663 [Ceratobasidium sp. AG-I]|nr:hypothetical protein BDV93DRAFT_332663 [Ceratobasidium sp. AG-I]
MVKLIPILSHVSSILPRVNHNPKPMERLPNETLMHVFSCVSRRRDLALASLVCYNWNVLAFAYLYHTLHLGRQIDVDSIAERILSEPEDNTLNSHRISSVLRCLTIDPIRYEPGGQAQSFPKQAVSKLVHLEHLSWSFLESPQSRFMPAFRYHCPNIRSVELKMMNGDLGGQGEP